MVLLGFAGEAAAQYVPGPPPVIETRPYYGGPLAPPADIELIEEPPPLIIVPPALPTVRGAPPYPGDAPSMDERAYSRHPRQPPDNGRPNGRMPAAPGARAGEDGSRGLRPPADIEEVTGTLPQVLPGVPGATTSPVALLPPDYRPEEGEPKELPPHLRRQLVDYPSKEAPGTIVVDTQNTYLYVALGDGKAMRYGIGVGREGFTWAGRERISKMAEWPDWTPPKEMIERQPYLPRFMAGGPTNPLGARALYLGNTLYRIHGTNQPSTIGTFVSSGCIRLLNEDIEDLFQRVNVGTRVVVLPGKPPPSAASAAAGPASAPAAR